MQVIVSFENRYNEAQNSHIDSLQFLKGIPKSGLFVCSFLSFEGAKKTHPSLEFRPFHL